MFAKVKSFFVKKNPTIKNDYTAYENGGKKEYDKVYDEYIQSVETLDAVIRTAANVASMAKMEVWKEDTKGARKPLKIKNVDLVYDINEMDSQADFIRKVFASVLTQGASIIIAEKGPSSNINFYPYDTTKFEINATAKSTVDSFTYTTEQGGEQEFKSKDVVYINNSIDITNLVYSMSRLKSLNDVLLMQSGLINNQKEFYSSGAKDSVIISPKEPISDEKMRLIQAAFTTFIQSNTTQALYLNTDIDVQSVSSSQSAAEVMVAVAKINTQMLRAFGMPEYLLGDYQGYVSDAAVVKASQIFFQIQLRPIFTTIAHQMTKYFRNTLKLPAAVVTFNFEDIDILSDSIETKMAVTEKAYKLGLMSMNEARVSLEMEALDTEEANLHFLPAYLLSSTPVAIEDYGEVKDSLFAAETGEDNSEVDGMNEDGTGSGSTGGEDNEEIDDATS